MPRWITCGSANTCERSLIGPAARRRLRAFAEARRAEFGGQRTQRPISSGRVREPRFVVDVARVLGEFRLAENGAQFAELAVVAGGDDDVAVGHRKHLIGDDVRMRVAHALWRLAGDQ